MSRKPGPARRRWRRATASPPRGLEERPRDHLRARGSGRPSRGRGVAASVVTGRAPASRTSARTQRLARALRDGTIHQAAPWKRPAVEAAKPRFSVPAIGCPPTKPRRPSRAGLAHDLALDARDVGEHQLGPAPPAPAGAAGAGSWRAGAARTTTSRCAAASARVAPSRDRARGERPAHDERPVDAGDAVALARERPRERAAHEPEPDDRDARAPHVTRLRAAGRGAPARAASAAAPRRSWP